MKSNSFLIIAFTTFYVLNIKSAAAEDFNCNGVIRNIPCDQQQLPKANDIPDVTAKSQDPDLSKKRSLFHDFDMKNVRARRELGVRLDISTVEDFCYKADTSLADCQEEILRMDDRLSLLIKDAKSEKEEQEKKEAEDKKVEQSGTNVTIVQERNIVINNSRRDHHHPDLHDHPGLHPDLDAGEPGEDEDIEHGKPKPSNPRLEDAEEIPWYQQPTKKKKSRQ